MTNPSVSVVITTYTGYGRYLEEAVHSVLSQTFQDFEIIIVDDASTDITPQYVEIMVKEDSRIRAIYNEKNMGMGISKNIGIEQATGKYIVCLDSDDTFEPTFLEHHVKAMEADKGDIIYSYMRYVGVTNYIEYKKPQSFEQIKQFCTTTHSALYKKSDWELVGGYKDVLLSDWEFWVNMAKNKKKFYIIPKCLFNYRKHPDALTMKGDIKKERMGSSNPIEQVRKCHPDLFPAFNFIDLENGGNYL